MAKSEFRAKYGVTKTHEDRAGWDIADPPCDTCKNRQFCKIGKFACIDFEKYTDTNRDNQISKTPSIRIYKRLFSNKVQINKEVP